MRWLRLARWLTRKSRFAVPRWVQESDSRAALLPVRSVQVPRVRVLPGLLLVLGLRVPVVVCLRLKVPVLPVEDCWAVLAYPVRWSAPVRSHRLVPMLLRWVVLSWAARC